MIFKKVYTYQEVTSAIYYDVIDMMGAEGLDAKLTAYDLLAVMAAPCTRLDFDKTDASKRTSLMNCVHSFLIRNKHLTSLSHHGLIVEINKNLLPQLDEEKQKELLTSFRMVQGFDSDGYAIFDKKYYDVYKGNMDKGNITRIRYTSISGKEDSKGLPDKEITRTYHVQKDNGLYHLDLDMTVEDWKDVLRGASVKAMQLINAFSQIDGHIASHSEIEEKFGILSDTINGVTAGLGNRAKRIMGIEVLGNDGNPRCWILPFNNGREDSFRGFLWELRPEVLEAYISLTKSN